MLLPSKAELGFEAHGANKLPSISFLFWGVGFVTWLSTWIELHFWRRKELSFFILISSAAPPCHHKNPLLSAAAKKISPASNLYIEEMEMALLQFPLHHTLKLALAAFENLPNPAELVFLSVVNQGFFHLNYAKVWGFCFWDGRHPHFIRNSVSKMWFVKSSTNLYQVLLHAHLFLLQISQVSSPHKQQLSSNGEHCSMIILWYKTIMMNPHYLIPRFDSGISSVEQPPDIHQMGEPCSKIILQDLHSQVCICMAPDTHSLYSHSKSLVAVLPTTIVT